ncbi:MAG TPA: ATP-binding protein [Acidobacteriaceae bacterium]|nr:ATP-binding protein [Acidobacteriaceae bacterium]
MNLEELKRILQRTLLLPVVALLLVAAVLALLIRNTTIAMDLVEHSDQVIAKTTEIQKLIVDQETGLRGYEATGNRMFMQPYNDAVAPLARDFSDLEILINDKRTIEGQPERFYTMKARYQLWLSGFAEPVLSIMDSGGNSSGVALNQSGKDMMDSVREMSDAIVRTAEARREDRLQRLHSCIRLSLAALVLLAILAGLTIGFYTRSEMRQVSGSFQKILHELQQYADDVYASEQRLRTTLNAIGDGVIVCNVEGGVEMMNPIAEDLCGWTFKDACGHPLEEVFHIVNEDTRMTVENPVIKVKRLDRIVGLANHTVLIRKDGAELNIDDSGAPIRDQSGTMVGIVLVFRDVTMEKKTQSALLANEKLAVAGRLAATIAHEIHNPLDSVSNLLYLLRSEPAAAESLQYLDLAQQELARVTQISRTMLSLYREAKSPVPVSMKDMLEGILLLLERRLLDMHVTVERDMPQELIVEGFPAELRQVFNNMIMNAAEAVENGGEMRIRLSAVPARIAGNKRLKRGVLVEITDNGPGIPPATMKRLFEPFFTTKGEHGTGLGLWVSRGIVEKHEGTIEISSNEEAPTHGTTVSIYLPSKPAVMRESATLPHSAPPPDSGNGAPQP